MWRDWHRRLAVYCGSGWLCKTEECQIVARDRISDTLARGQPRDEALPMQIISVKISCMIRNAGHLQTPMIIVAISGVGGARIIQ